MALEKESSGSPSASSPNHLQAQFFRYRRHQSTPSPFSGKLNNSPASGAASDSDCGVGAAGGCATSQMEESSSKNSGALETLMPDSVAIIPSLNSTLDGFETSSLESNDSWRQKPYDATLNSGEPEEPAGSTKTTTAAAAEPEADAKNRDGKKSV